MKRIFGIMAVYTVLIFVACIAISFFWGNIPQLLPGAEKSFTFFRALKWFLFLLAPITLTGFIAGCTVDWRIGENVNVARFSSAMFERFKKVLLVGIVIAAALTLNKEIFLPLVEGHLQSVCEAPDELAKNLFFARKFQIEGKPLLSWQYAVLAQKVAPTDEDALRMVKETSDTLERVHENAITYPETVEHVDMPIYRSDTVYTVKELLDKSDAAAAKEEWFNAHYWATLAMQACSGTDTNLSRAQDAANLAWNHLSNPSGFNNEDEKNYYATKKEGYAALNSGDNLKAYYIFTGLSRSSAEHASDPDVVRYLAIAKERVESEYFFIDETQDLRLQEDAHNIYFTLSYPSGDKLVISIRGSVTLKQTGSYVRYFDGLSITQYDSRGKFVRSLSVPFAKAMALPVGVLDETTRASLGVQKYWRTIPYIQLQSVDRITEGIVSKPQYLYEETGLPQNIADANGMHIPEQTVTTVTSSELPPETTYLFLPMDYDDFDVVTHASSGADAMQLLTLHSFVPQAEAYGFAKEVYNQSYVSRLMYAFFILIMVVFTAMFAWNYRISDDRSPFKFGWVFMFPLITGMITIAMDIMSYLYTITNYLVVGMFGSAAIFVALGLNVLILFIVSIAFLARHAN